MNQPYRVLIVDDEPPARDVIEVFVERVPNLHCVAKCTNALEALDAIQRLKPDLVFLDIQMPEMSGLDLMNLSLPSRPAIILTTAHSAYALQSYEFGVIDYLLKPIAFDRFMQAVAKFMGQQTHTPSVGSWSAVEASTGVPKNEMYDNQVAHEAVWLREEKRLLQIPYADIMYVEGMKDYVKVFLKDQMIMTHMNIGKAAEIFCPPVFVRIHRSHIVRRSAIRLIDGNRVQLANGVELLIGPLYRDELKKFISALR